MKTCRDGSVRPGAMGGFLLLLLALHSAGYAMTSEELIERLKKAGAPEVGVLQAFPVKIEEEPHEFLGGGTYLRVSVRNPHHPHLLHYVAGPEGEIYRLKLGKPELHRMQEGLKIRIEDEEAALRYAQWLLQVTEGPALWLLSSVEDVPFQPVAEGEEELAKRIEKSRKDLAKKISAPSARATKDGYSVTQEAVHGQNLVRYEVTVSAKGKTDVKKQILDENLPVVYVLEG